MYLIHTIKRENIMPYIGDFTPNKVIYHKFNTSDTGGAPIILTGASAPGLVVYKDNSSVNTFTGLTLTVNFNSVTGLNHVAIDTSTNSTFYSTGSNFSVLIATGTVSSISVVGKEVCTFSINNRSALRPLVADNTLDTVLVGTGLASFNGRLPATLSTSGYMKSDIQSVTGVVVTTTGNIQADIMAISGDTLALRNLLDLLNSGYNSLTHAITTVTNLVNFTGSVGSVTGSVGSVAGNVVGSVGAVLGGIGSNVSGNVVGSVGAVLGGVGTNVSGGVLGSVSGSVQSVRTNVSGNIGGTLSGNVIGSVGAVLGGVGTNVSGNVIGSVGSVTGTVNANLIAISGVPQSAWDLKAAIDSVESGVNLQATLRLLLSSAAAKLTGAEAGNTIYIRDYNDTKNRITATVDASGNRTAITYILT